MNIFRSLIGKVWHDPNAAEVVKISTGQLYLVRPGNIRTSRECIYNDAMIAIRRVPSVDHNFQLVVTRVYEEGDQELLEDEEETDEERVFLIAEELEFRTGQTEGEPTFVWRDLDGDVDEFFEFIATGTNEPTQAFFETCMYRAMYERKYKASADGTHDSDLKEFIWEEPQKKVAKGKSPQRGQAAQTKTRSTDQSDLAGAMKSLAVSPSAPATTRTTVKSPVDDFPLLAAEEAELHYWERDKGYFIKQADGTAKIVKRPNAGYEYWMIASAEEGQLLTHKITPEMNQRWSTKMWSLTWNHLGEKGSQSSWCFRFLTQDAFANFQKAFTRALWESLHQSSWEKSKNEDQAYVLSSNLEDVEMEDGEDNDDEEEAVLEELESEERSDSDGEEPDEDEDLPQALSKGDRNSQLTVGYKGDRSYVVRGNSIGVFSHSGDNQVKYYATISKIANTKGKEFNPQKVMLHDQDNKMVLMNPAEPNSLYAMDIERGKIIDEWKVHDNVPVHHIAPDNKFAQTTVEQTLVGASGNALFRIDPRVSGTKMVDSQYKQYTGKNKFSGITTTADGKLAVASEKGDIRLFDAIGKNAKTALPPLGDPILGIDVTSNGRWIVATTKTYLLLVDTLIGEGKYTGSLGFDRSFPATSKPIPKRLQLRAEHVAYMNHDVAFTPARFNMGESQEENAIVTSTGQFVVAWDFTKIKKGQLDKYHIKKYEDFVVQDNFKFGDDKEIIVALQNNVLAVNKKNLQRPTRASLAPMNSPHSRSDVVNSPY